MVYQPKLVITVQNVYFQFTVLFIWIFKVSLGALMMEKHNKKVQIVIYLHKAG